MSLEVILALRVLVDKENFVSYTEDKQYVLNLGYRQLETWVNYDRWDGEARCLDTNTVRLHLTEK